MKRVETNVIGGSVYPSPSRDVPPASPTNTFQRVLTYSTSTNRTVPQQQLQTVTNMQTQAQSQQALHQAQAHQLIRQPKAPIATVISTVTQPASAIVTAAALNPVLAAVPVLSGQGSQQFQRLKVEDALSYLDQVKYKFGNQPQVYNDFLDIMKEFKSQSIDTPGVIARVSNLFRGHPQLIVGFNTFLPPGYKIEVQHNEVSVSMPRQATPTVIHTHGPISTSNNSITIKTSLTPTPVPSIEPQVVPMPPKSITPELTQAVFSSLMTTVANVAAAQQPVAQVPMSVPTPTPAGQQQTSSTGQPVEFNHAINYVNKIKNRFQGQPDTYKQFLEILHTYQKEQRNIKEGSSVPVKHLSETEVYAQVARLFQHQEDLLREFGQFLPDATNNQSFIASSLSATSLAAVLPPSVTPTPTISSSNNKAINNDHTSIVKKPSAMKNSQQGNVVSSKYSSQPMKRPLSLSLNQPHMKRPKMTSLRDVTLAEAGKYGTLTEFAYFDKVRKAIHNKEVYDNFLRCLVLFNQEIISRTELLSLVTPFLGKFPELFKWFKDFLGCGRDAVNMEPISNTLAKQERMGDTEVDYSTCKRLGASYCALPKNYVQPKCSGRTALCKEVLNDIWVSFPSWSEDSTFVSSRKTQFEEYIYRCEDERFELDLVLEVNAATIQMLETVQKKLSRMTSEEANKFRLDEFLHGPSGTIHQRAIRRMYGDKAPDIIDGLIRNPAITLPIILRRMKTKEEEWREAQKGFNKIWQEQNEKFYLKSLDHQGINFKQNDTKGLRSKSLLNEIESLFDERHEQNDDNNMEPHLMLVYKDKSILDDAATLLIHHVKRQIAFHKDDKQKMKQLLRQFVPDLFFHPRQDLSEDERDEDDEEMDTSHETEETKETENKEINKPEVKEEPETTETPDETKNDSSEEKKQPQMDEIKKKQREEKLKFTPQSSINDADESYTLFMGNNNWYLFLRLHYILCERLTKMYERANTIARDEIRERPERKESTSTALKLKPQHNIRVEDYYPAFLDMVKNVLDGNMESNFYEDTLREMFGIHAYIAFTLDKVVSCAVRQLQNIVTEESCMECTNLYLQEQKRGATGGTCITAAQRCNIEASYQRRAEQALLDENCFRFVFYKLECKLTVFLLDTEMDEPEPAEEVEKWSTYIERYITLSGESMSDDLREQFTRKPVFLPRNLKPWVTRKGEKRAEEKKATSEDIVDEEIKDEPMGEEDEDFLKTDEEMPPLEDDKKPPEIKPPPERMGTQQPSNISMIDNSECNFGLKTHKMFFIVNSDTFMHKHNALNRARDSHRSVTLRMNKNFKKWHQKFIDENVTKEQKKETEKWLVGEVEGFVPHRTRVLTDNDINKTPYASYNRYRVKTLDSNWVNSNR